MSKIDYHKANFKKRYALPKYHKKGPQIVGSMSSKVKFGKYIGYTIQRIIENDPNYMKWLIDKCLSIQIEPHLLTQIKQKLND